MVRSDIGSSGVIFTLDTESGFRDAVFITSSYGLGETVVQGAVNPDEFYVYKPNLERHRHAILRRNLGDKAVRMVYGEQHQLQSATHTENVESELQSQFSISGDEVHNLASLAGFFIGNTAEKVLHQLDCSVLAVKPDGFVTPVELE